MENKQQEPTFKWTEEKAKKFLEKRNQAFWKDKYSEDKKIDFDCIVSPEFQINLLLGDVIFSSKIHQAASVHEVKIAEVFSKHGHDKEQQVFNSGSDISDNQSESHLDIANRIVSAAQFLGITIDKRNSADLNLTI